jgi:ubiquitin-protein ligase
MQEQNIIQLSSKNFFGYKQKILIVLLFFFLKKNVNIWRVALLGPDESPCSSFLYYLSITFSNDYSSVPPDIKFVYPPFHLNITEQGQICLAELHQAYRSHFHVFDL